MVVATLLLACAPSRPAASTSADSTSVAPLTCTRRLRFAGDQDVSKSGSDNATPLATGRELDPLVHLIVQCGGEFAWGTIREKSTAPLLRFHVPAPELPPSRPSFAGPSFQVAKRKRQYTQQLEEYHHREAARVDDATRRANEFRVALAQLLSAPRNAQRTDIWRAIARLHLYLNEAEPALPPTSQQAARLVALAVTDGEDNIHARPIAALPPGSELLIVNSFPLPGALDRLHPRRFESIEAAVRWIVATHRAVVAETNSELAPGR